MTEVIAASVQFAQELARIAGGFRLFFEHFLWGSDSYPANDHYIPHGRLGGLKTFDAICLGAVCDALRTEQATPASDPRLA